MAHNDMNCEGMTFQEWVLAAGKAKFGHISFDGVFPYTTSYKTVVYASNAQKRCGIQNSLKWVSITHYPKKIRQAWRNGEDPSEWRDSVKR